MTESIPIPARCSPTTTAGFVGRTSECQRILDVFKHVGAESSHRVILVGGDPGIGKTTLVTHCAQSVHVDGATILFGRAAEDLGTPYGLWVEALTHLVGHASEDLMTALAPFGSSVARMSPVLAAAFDVPDDAPISDPEAERYFLFNAVTSTLRIAGQGAPVVLVLDDL